MPNLDPEWSSCLVTWYLQTTKQIKVDNQGVCDKYGLKAWLIAHAAEDKHAVFKLKCNKESAKVLPKQERLENIELRVASFMSEKKSSLFCKQQGPSSSAEAYKFHLMNYESSDISNNLMEFSKKLILVRLRQLVPFVSASNC